MELAMIARPLFKRAGLMMLSNILFLGLMFGELARRPGLHIRRPDFISARHFAKELR
jgi:hypothetical protein